MAKFCRSVDGSAISPTTPSNLSQCVASAVFAAVPESLTRRLSVAGLALAEVLQEEELAEVSCELRNFYMLRVVMTFFSFSNLTYILSQPPLQSFLATVHLVLGST